MKHQTKPNGSVAKKGRTRNNGGNAGSYSCPRCGGEMISSSQGVTTKYPSPALERLVCSDSGCNYARYVKLDESGFADEREAVGEKGA